MNRKAIGCWPFFKVFFSLKTILTEARGHVKTAVVMKLANVSRVVAEKAIKQADGFVKQAIECAKKEV